jgi:hypothetical protein
MYRQLADAMPIEASQAYACNIHRRQSATPSIFTLRNGSMMRRVWSRRRPGRRQRKNHE